jgi:hypothetical protein
MTSLEERARGHGRTPQDEAKAILVFDTSQIPPLLEVRSAWGYHHFIRTLRVPS